MHNLHQDWATFNRLTFNLVSHVILTWFMHVKTRKKGLELVEKYELAAIQIIEGTYCIMSIPNFLQSTVSHCSFCCFGGIMA